MNKTNRAGGHSTCFCYAVRMHLSNDFMMVNDVVKELCLWEKECLKTEIWDVVVDGVVLKE